MDVNGISPVRTKIERSEQSPAASNKKRAQESAVVEKGQTVSRSELENAVDQANEIGQLLNRKLDFTIDEATEKVVVSVLDGETGEVVRQIPPDEMLRISAHLKQLQEMNHRVMSAVKSVILDVRY